MRAWCESRGAEEGDEGGAELLLQEFRVAAAAAFRRSSGDQGLTRRHVLSQAAAVASRPDRGRARQRGRMHKSISHYFPTGLVAREWCFAFVRHGELEGNCVVVLISDLQARALSKPLRDPRRIRVPCTAARMV